MENKAKPNVEDVIQAVRRNQLDECAHPEATQVLASWRANVDTEEPVFTADNCTVSNCTVTPHSDRK
jgi:hypothetical protein